MLIARNLGAALQRYHRDVMAIFEFASDNLLAGTANVVSPTLMESLRFRSICLIEVETGAPPAWSAPPRRVTGDDGVDVDDPSAEHDTGDESK